MRVRCGVPERVLLVVNEKAGSFGKTFAPLVQKQAPRAEIGPVEKVGEGAWDLVVACGGDGTVRRVVNAMVQTGSNAALGIVPLGTANVIARALELPSKPDAALHAALSTVERRVDVGVCDGEAFLLGCGLGVAERFVTATGHAEKRRWGAMAYLKTLLGERDAPEVEFRIEADGASTRLRGVGLVVANMAQLGQDVRPLADSSHETEPDDGRLALILLRHANLWSLVRIGIKGFFGASAKDRSLKVVPFAGGCISSEPKVPIQIDGDPVEQTSPFEFTLLPKRLRVRVGSDDSAT